VIHTPGLKIRISPFYPHKGKPHSLYIKITHINIPYIFYSTVLFVQIIHLIMFHLRIRICAAQQVLRSTIHLRIPVQLRNFCFTAILQTFLGTFILYNFPKSSCNPAFSYVLLNNFKQMYMNVRLDLVPMTLQLCITVLLIHGSMFSLMMATYTAETCSWFTHR
jgi:hypothetical protein